MMQNFMYRFSDDTQRGIVEVFYVVEEDRWIKRESLRGIFDGVWSTREIDITEAKAEAEYEKATA